MKALLKRLLTPVLCCGVTLGGSSLVSWWNAPPPEPGPEAAALVKSLQEGEGWHMAKTERGRECIAYREVSIQPRDAWLCSPTVRVSGSEVNEHFSWTDLQAINRAALARRRELHLQGLREAERQQGKNHARPAH